MPVERLRFAIGTSSPRSSIARYHASCPCVGAQACSCECQPGSGLSGATYRAICVATHSPTPPRRISANETVPRPRSGLSVSRLFARANLVDRPREIAVPFERVHREVEVRVDISRPGASAWSANHESEEEHAGESRDRDDGLQHRPRRHRLRHVMLKYSFTSQNPPSLTCDAMSEPAPIATTSSSRFTRGIAAAIGAMMLAAVTTATVAEPTDTRSSDAITQPSTSGESVQSAHRLRDRRVDAGRVEHAAEPAAGADDEQHAGDRRQRLLGEPQEPVAIEAAGPSEACKARGASPTASRRAGCRRTRAQRRARRQAASPAPAPRGASAAPAAGSSGA